MRELKMEIMAQAGETVLIKTNLDTLRKLGREPGSFKGDNDAAEMLAYKTFITARECWKRQTFVEHYGQQPALYAAAEENAESVVEAQNNLADMATVMRGGDCTDALRRLKAAGLVGQVHDSFVFEQVLGFDPCPSCPYKDSDNCSEECEYRSKLINGPCGGPPP